MRQPKVSHSVTPLNWSVKPNLLSTKFSIQISNYSHEKLLTFSRQIYKNLEWQQNCSNRQKANAQPNTKVINTMFYKCTFLYLGEVPYQVSEYFHAGLQRFLHRNSCIRTAVKLWAKSLRHGAWMNFRIHKKPDLFYGRGRGIKKIYFKNDKSSIVFRVK